MGEDGSFVKMKVKCMHMATSFLSHIADDKIPFLFF